MKTNGLTRREDFLCSILIPTLNLCIVIGILPGIPPDPDTSWLTISSHVWGILFPFLLIPLADYCGWLRRTGGDCAQCKKLEEIEVRANIEGQRNEKSGGSTDASATPRTVCIFCSGPPFFSSVGRAVDICATYWVASPAIMFVKAMILLNLSYPVCEALVDNLSNDYPKKRSVEKVVLRSVCCCAWVGLMAHRWVVRVLSKALDFSVPARSTK